MKGKRILSIFTVMLALLVAACVFVACNGDYKTITFETGGGTAIQSIVAKAGEAIIPPADPVKADFDFVGWSRTEGGEVEDLPTSMPNGNVTYYAVWAPADKTGTYTIEYHLENVAGDDFPVNDARTQTLSGKVGEPITVTPAEIGHMRFVPERSSALTFECAAGGGVVKLYYERESITLTFMANDDVVSAEIETKYGRTPAFPTADLENGGKLFVGWAESKDADSDSIIVPGGGEAAEKNAVYYAQFGDVHLEAFGGEDRVATGRAGQDGACVAVYIASDGAREWGTANGSGANCRVQTEHFKGIFDDNGNFRKDETGKYVAYDLSEDRSGVEKGTLSLDSATGVAVYTVGDVEKSGAYSYVSYGAAGGELMMTFQGESPIYFKLKAASAALDGYDGEFIVKGAEAGEYGVVSDYLNLGVEDLYKVSLDGYGRVEFPLGTLSGLSLAYGSYKGFDAASGVWQFEFGGFIEGVESDTIYAQGGYRSCTFVLRDAVKKVNGSEIEREKVFVRDIPGTAGRYTSDAGTLTLDGFGTATIVEGDVVASATYEAAGYGSVECVISSTGDRRYFSLNAVDNAYSEVDSSAGSYAIGQFEIQLGGFSRATAQKQGQARILHKDRVIATGLYAEGEADGEYAFSPDWVDFLYPMINGIAVGGFSFKLSGDDLVMRNESLYGEFALDGGGTLNFDGYGNVTMSGGTYAVGMRVSNTVIVNGQGYVLDLSDRTAQLASGLTGEYYTAVDEYVGPGKLAFDGNGIALFYNMVNGGLSGQGSYTYDEDTGIGEFIPEPNADMSVERFKFILTSATDQYGVQYDRVYFKYQDLGRILLEEPEFTLDLSGYGYFTDNYSDASSNYYELTFFGQGAKYVNTKSNIELEGGTYVIRYKNFAVDKSEGAAKYMIDKETAQYSITVTFGDQIFGFENDGESISVVGSDFGTFNGYSSGTNLVDTEVFVSLDGKGGAQVWCTRRNEEFSYEGTYTVDGQDIIFRSFEDAGGVTYGMTFRLVTVTLSGGQGTMRVFQQKEQQDIVDAYEYKFEGGMVTPGTARLVMDGYGDVTYTGEDGTVKRAQCGENVDLKTITVEDENGDEVEQTRLSVRFDDGDIRMFLIEFDMGASDMFMEMGFEAQTYKFYDGSPRGSASKQVILDGFGNATLKAKVGTIMGIIDDIQEVASGSYAVDPEDTSRITITVASVVEEYAEQYKAAFGDTEEFGIVVGSLAGLTTVNYVFAMADGFDTVYETEDGKTITVDGFSDVRVSGFEGVDSSFAVNFTERDLGGKRVQVLTLTSKNGRTVYVYYFEKVGDGLKQLHVECSLE